MGYGIVTAAAMLAALLATPVLMRLAMAIGAVDRPGTRKVHVRVVPRLGGMAIILSLFAALGLAALADPAAREGLMRPQAQGDIAVLFGTGALVFFVGLVDDIWRMRARAKLIGQVLAAACVCSCGIRIEGIGVEGLFAVQFGWLSWPLTVLWLVGVTNAVNLIDGLDGLASGTSAVACAVLATFALVEGQVALALIMLAMLGGLSGFLFFNFNPAKMFLGDCGSMFLGFSLATVSVMSAKAGGTLVGLALATLALGVPVLDTFFSIVRRIVGRRSLFAPDRCHTHHRLMDSGWSHRGAVLILYGVSLAAGAGGLLMLVTDGLVRLAVFASGLVGLVYLFHRLGAIRFREAVESLKRNMAMSRAAGARRRKFEEMQLRLREVVTIPQWWRVVRRAGRHLGFARICVDVQYDDGQSRQLQWQAPACSSDGGNGKAIHLTLPVRHWPNGETVRASIDIPVNGSLETASSRLTLFGRLMDEHSLADLPDRPGCEPILPRSNVAVAPGEPVVPEDPEPYDGVYPPDVGDVAATTAPRPDVVTP